MAGATAAFSQNSDNVSLNRLSAIAYEIQSPISDGPALFKEAVKLCGFRLRTEQGSILSTADDGTDLHLDITDAEVRDYVDLFRRGQGMTLMNLTGGIDAVLKNIGYSGSCKADVYKWLQTGAFSPNASTRALTGFILDLGSEHASPADMGISDGTTLDAIQSLLILRVLTEEIEMPLRRRIPKQSLLASLDLTGRYDFTAAPGYAQDAFVGGVSALMAKIDEWATQEGEKALASKLSKINPILAIVKTITSYALLQGKIEVEDPGAPLVRTKSTDPSTFEEKRTLVAHFYYDKNKVTDFLKDYRPLLAAAGLDTDMPKGDLNGVETAWEFLTPVEAIQQTFRGVAGQTDPSRIVTDADGKARYKVEGVPQHQALIEDLVFPVTKKYTVNVTPQLKKPGAGADGTDISLACLGLLTGGSDAVVGGATLVAEFLNRAKWANKTPYVLEVKDWTNAKVLGDVMLHFKSRAPLGGDALIQDQMIEVHDVIMTAIGQPAGAPTLSPEQMKYLTPDQLAQVKAAMAQVSQAPPTYIIDPKFTTMGTASLKDMDRGFVTTESWTEGPQARFMGNPYPNTGPTAAGFAISLDLKTKKASVLGASLGDVEHTKKTNGTDEKTTEIVRSGVGHDFNVSFTSMLRADTPENAVPFTIEHPDAKTTVYRGSRLIKADNEDRHASLEVSFTLRVRR